MKGPVFVTEFAEKSVSSHGFKDKKVYICDMRLMCILAIVFGPWITDMGENGFSVLWTSDNESIGWVQLEDGTRVYDEFAGRRMPGRFHSVRLNGLEEGERVSYSVGIREIINHTNPRRPVYGEEIVDGPYSVRTFTHKSNTCRFTVLNDIHMDTEIYREHVSHIDVPSTDFVFLNGDIISAGHYPVDSLAKYDIAPLGDCAASVPVMFARGNHEGRGTGVKNVSEVFPNSGDLPFTYMFREGPAAFLVLDAGETSVTNSLALSGDSLYVDYIRNQIEWTSKAVKSPQWRHAKVRICFIHVPMAFFGDPSEYELCSWLNRNFLPVLNRAGVDLMISADFHEYEYHPAGSHGNKFPIIVNDDVSRLETRVEGRNINVKIYNREGDEVHSHSF